MEISLRKANALQFVIREEIAKYNVSGNIDVDQYSDIEREMENHRIDTINNIKMHERLTNILYDIRMKVNNANNLSGISDLLAKVAIAEKNIIIFDSAGKTKPSEPVDIIKRRVTPNISGDDDRYTYRRETTVSVNTLHPVDIEVFANKAASLKKEKRDMQDKLLELNISNKIVIEGDDAHLLLDLKLL